MGASQNYCDFIKGGAGTEENRKEFLAILLAEFKKEPVTKATKDCSKLFMNML